MASRGLHRTVGFALGVLLGGAAPALAEPTAAGTWNQVDDKTGGVGALVSIRQEGASWSGYIVKIFPDPSDPPNPVCSACKGALKGKPVVGLKLMHDLTRNGNTYSGGTIVDPQDGTEYNVTLTLSPDGGRLTVRGYVGIEALGRSQVWTRAARGKRGAGRS